MTKLLSTFALCTCIIFECLGQMKGHIVFDTKSAPNKFKTIITPKGDSLYESQDRWTFNTSQLPWSPSKLIALSNDINVLSTDDNGAITWYQTKSRIDARTNNSNLKFSDQLKSDLRKNSEPAAEFVILSSDIDNLRIQHHTIQELWNQIPVIGSEYKVHEFPDQTMLVSGKFQKPNITDINPRINPEQAIQLSRTFLATQGEKFFSISPLKNQVPQNKLCYFNNADQWYLAYEIKIMPNAMSYYTVYVDALASTVITHYSNICKSNHCNHNHNYTPSPLGAETANAVDLFGISRLINTWKEGSTYYMLDGSRPMFNLSKSTMPDEPAGGILTLDGMNTAFNEKDFRVDHVKSSNNSWNNPTAVSAHYNAAKAYEYYRTVHNRNSIDGKGGTITSIINVRDENGAKMDNAFWNGEAMFYGGGDRAFTSLAKALDVAGHEMSHGVVQNTANLAYQGESGALNESFADIFGAMIDRDDWKMGEDVVVKSFFPSGALRDLSNPNNGGRSGDNYYQPKHVNEQYKGTQDNGGVHINSGIPNYAFYLFVQELAKGGNEEAGKVIAEKVFYDALTKYMTRSMVFKDLRVAVETSCKTLYSSNANVLAAAQKAFDAVGILGAGGTGGGGNPTNYQKDLAVNNGKELILCTDDKQDGVYTFDPSNNNIVQLSSTSILSKPSVTDNGGVIIFVGDDTKLHRLVLNRSTGKYTEDIADPDPFYRNAVISKDGKRIAALGKVEENLLYMYDFGKANWTEFKLYNPTYSQGVNAGNVRYADFMDFDHSGQSVMYDALSNLKKNDGSVYEYWDIGFINVFNNGSNTIGDGKVEKLFSNLEENTSVGNPVFSKNSPYIITFDYIDQQDNAILGANVEAGKLGEIQNGLDMTGYPNYNVKDDKIIFDATDNSGHNNLYIKSVASGKITGSGNPSSVILDAKWGTWFANGNRNLYINTKEIEFIREMMAYPNPITNDFSLRIKSTKNENAIASIFNILGQEILNQSLTIQEGLNDFQFQTSHLSPGAYELKLISKTGIITTKLIKN